MEALHLDKNGIWVDDSTKSISYPDEGNSNSFAVEDKSFWFKHRNNIIKEVIHRFPFEGNYADIGAGNGLQAKFVSDNFKQAKVFVIEPGYQGCLNARKRNLENVFNVPFQKFDFVANNVRAVGMYDVIEHIEDDVKFLNELKKCMPKDSLIYITVPAHNYLWSDVDDYGGHFRRYDKKMIKELAEKSSVELLFTSYFFMYIPPLTYFLRSLPYKFKGNRGKDNILQAEEEQHNPSTVVLKVFDFFHKKEINKIRKSSVSMGASCIAVFKT